MTDQYVFAIAGHFVVREHPDVPGVRRPLPTDVSVTTVGEQDWPIWHAAFGRQDLTGLWWYAPADTARPTLAAALAYLDVHVADLALTARPGSDTRRVVAQQRILARILTDLDKHADSVIAVGVQPVPVPVWEPVELEDDW